MDHRHAIAYLFILLIVLGLGSAWYFTSGEARARRRHVRRFDRRQRERREERIAEEES